LNIPPKVKSLEEQLFFKKAYTFIAYLSRQVRKLCKLLCKSAIKHGIILSVTEEMQW